MLEVRGDADLAEKPLRSQYTREVGVQHLERDLAIVLQVTREIDRGHPAPAELVLEHVAVAQGIRQRTWRYGHVVPAEGVPSIWPEGQGYARRRAWYIAGSTAPKPDSMHPRPLAIALFAIGFVVAVRGHPTAAQVEPFPAGFRTQRIPTNGTTLYVRVCGTGAGGGAVARLR
jgi:hypothetical protein